ncbi:hypothetical protein ACL03H_13060 [Saccharopolyspora sp. MS10]|uniref:hypothetical protein n=1 Tax=Saccharopolyspora sp. MS10 TaxID=3385973 RepID=UPI00399FAEAC
MRIKRTSRAAIIVAGAAVLSLGGVGTAFASESVPTPVESAPAIPLPPCGIPSGDPDGGVRPGIPAGDPDGGVRPGIPAGDPDGGVRPGIPAGDPDGGVRPGIPAGDPEGGVRPVSAENTAPATAEELPELPTVPCWGPAPGIPAPAPGVPAPGVPVPAPAPGVPANG